MSILEAILYGLVQGITEFLPISSTAHVVILQHLLNQRLPSLVFEIILHLASVLAVIFYFRKDCYYVIKGFFSYILKRENTHKTAFYFALYILIATLITGALGVLFSDLMGEQLKTPKVIAVSLALTGLFLIYIERLHRYGNREEADMRWLDSIIVGLGQSVAIFPGISRSGSTLVTALLIGLNRETAVRYSFLLAIPVILGSSVLAFKDMNAAFIDQVGILPLIVAFISTFIFSILGILWCIDFLKRSKLVYFAIYCFIVAVLVFFFLDGELVVEL